MQSRLSLQLATAVPPLLQTPTLQTPPSPQSLCPAHCTVQCPSRQRYELKHWGCPSGPVPSPSQSPTASTCQVPPFPAPPPSAAAPGRPPPRPPPQSSFPAPASSRRSFFSPPSPRPAP